MLSDADLQRLRDGGPWNCSALEFDRILGEIMDRRATGSRAQDGGDAEAAWEEDAVRMSVQSSFHSVYLMAWERGVRRGRGESANLQAAAIEVLAAVRAAYGDGLVGDLYTAVGCWTLPARSGFPSADRLAVAFGKLEAAAGETDGYDSGG